MILARKEGSLEGRKARLRMSSEPVGGSRTRVELRAKTKEESDVHRSYAKTQAMTVVTSKILNPIYIIVILRLIVMLIYTRKLRVDPTSR